MQERIRIEQFTGNKTEVADVSMHEGTEALRVLARFIARRLQRDVLAKTENADQTMILDAESPGQETRQ